MPDFYQQQLHQGAFSGTIGPDTGVTSMSPFVVAGQTFEAVHMLARRVQILSDRLTGAVPMPGDAKAPLDAPPPLFSALMLESNRANDSVRLANEAIDRIERMLA